MRNCRLRRARRGHGSSGPETTKCPLRVAYVVHSEGASYITIYNFSSKVTCSLCLAGSRASLPFLLAIHVDERPILGALAPRGISTSGRTTREAEYRASRQPRTRRTSAEIKGLCASAKEPPPTPFARRRSERARSGALDVEASYTAAPTRS